jgi:hypothetical protein
LTRIMQLTQFALIVEELPAALEEVARLRERLALATYFVVEPINNDVVWFDGEMWHAVLAMNTDCESELGTHPTADDAFAALAAWQEGDKR